jgi:uncharacterized protein YjiS (DUF1127 family)
MTTFAHSTLSRTSLAVATPLIAWRRLTKKFAARKEQVWQLWLSWEQWMDARRERRQLLSADDHLLRDIGVSRGEAEWASRHGRAR